RRAVSARSRARNHAPAGEHAGEGQLGGSHRDRRAPRLLPEPRRRAARPGARLCRGQRRSRPAGGPRATTDRRGGGLGGRPPHRWCDRVQDAYSLRCAPQVHGASRDLLDYVDYTISVELNAATDNPLVLVEDDMLVSNGNFHGQPLAFALDALAMALAELANISERRLDRLVN